MPSVRSPHPGGPSPHPAPADAPADAPGDGTPPWVELHAHSAYSFLDGASPPEALARRARELGQPALALTDHDGLYGSMEFARAAEEAGIHPITGVELTVAMPDGARAHLTLLAESSRGYGNLSELVTETHRRGPRGDVALPLERVLDPARTEGLLLLTGCRQGPLHHAARDSVAGAEALAREMVEAFGPRQVFVELQANRVRGDAGRMRVLGALADRLDLPVVATGNTHYHRAGLHRLQDVLVAIRHRTTLDGAHAHRRPNACFHLASAGEMARRFAGRPDALRTSLEIAERCRGFHLARDLDYVFPDFRGSHRGSAMEVLAELAGARLEARYPPERRDEARARLDEELRLVERHGLAGFFLVYHDIMELAREVAHRVRRGSARSRAGLPPGRGRGSSVSSIICYLIGLSHVDPVASNLFLGRFLNDAMGSVPDIDLDFPREIREELILAVHERWGHDHTGLVATFPTYRLRSAVREVGKALEIPPGDLEKIARLAEHRSAGGLREDLAHMPEFADRAGSRPWELFLARVEEIAGLPRHISQHVGGMVISSRPLHRLVPLEPAAMEGRFLCQWDKDSCADAGFIKIDFLALGMLSLVEEAVDLIDARRPAGAEPLDLSRIDLEDEAVHDRIAAGDTVGIFQVESRAQIQMIRRTRPRTLPDLAIQVALVRPGPIVGGAVNPYVRRREALRRDPAWQPPVDHPLLEEPLAETLGVIVFQDQVLQVCQALAGFTDGQAESLRRAMSRKRSGEAMRAHREAFLEGARARGVDDEVADRVFQQVVGFSEFGFPKSHAAAFALLAYQSAWLRHHFPTEYYVALFNNQPMGFYSLDALGRDAGRNGIRVLPPHLERSGVRCTPEGDDLRVGLGFVRGWGEEVAHRVVAEREARGPFRSLPDFLARTPSALRRPAVENLVWVGGLDHLGMGRRELLWQTGLWLGPDEERGGGRGRGRADDPQLALGLGDLEDRTTRFGPVDARDGLVAEYRMLRFSTATHPLALVREELSPGLLTSRELPSTRNGATVGLAGLVVARQRPHTARGYIFILVEDEHGHVNVIVRPEVYRACRNAVRLEPFLEVEGRLQKDGDSINVIATRIRGLRTGAGTAASGTLPDPMHYWPDPKKRGGEAGAGAGAGAGAAPTAPSAPPAAELEAAGPQAAGATTTAWRFLETLRESPPGTKSWG